MTASTRAQLTTEVAANFTSNGTGGITAAIARTTFADFIASFATLADANTFVNNITINPASGTALTLTPASATTDKAFAATQTGPANGATTASRVIYNSLSLTSGQATSGGNSQDATDGLRIGSVMGLYAKFVDSNNTTANIAETAVFSMLLTSGATQGDRVAVVANAYSTTASSAGYLLGLSAAAQINTGATVVTLAAAQFETYTPAGTITNRYGIEVSATLGAVQGSGLDAAIVIDSGGSAPYKKGIAFGGAVLTGGIATTGDMFFANTSMTVANVFSMSNVTVTGNILNFPNFVVTGASGVPVQTMTQAIAANTSGDGIVLQNTTASTTGNQRFSPRMRLTSQGFVAGGVNASQPFDIILENQPTQTAGANVQGGLVISAQPNSAGYQALMKVFFNANGNTQTSLISPSGKNANITWVNGTNNVWYASNTGGSSDLLQWLNSDANSNAAVLSLSQTKSVVVGSAAIATNATDGFLYFPSCAGTPTGVPTAFTGRVAIIYDTTNNKIAVYNGAWKQTAALT